MDQSLGQQKPGPSGRLSSLLRLRKGSPLSSHRVLRIMLLALVSAAAGSAITLAVVLRVLLYFKTGGAPRDRNLERVTIAMYGVAALLSAVAVWLAL